MEKDLVCRRKNVILQSQFTRNRIGLNGIGEMGEWLKPTVC